MKYFYDFEFMDDGKTIKPISIGMVTEDGSREFYAEFADAKLYEANPWVQENVIPHLWAKESDYLIERDWDNKRIQGGHWFPDRISEALIAFCDPEKYGKIEWWGYYSAYDHVALCQLFGPMIDLPKGWPMYTNDLKQLCVSLGDPRLPQQEGKEHHALEDARWNLSSYAWLIHRGYYQSVGRTHRVQQSGEPTFIYTPAALDITYPDIPNKEQIDEALKEED